MSKVVVVDDEPFILTMIEEKLKKAGIHVVTIRESREAFTVIRREKPDLVILDWMMPEVSGIDICKMVKSDMELRETPVLLLTAKSQDAEKETGLRCGASMYITKPFSPKALLEIVTKVIEGK